MSVLDLWWGLAISPIFSGSPLLMFSEVAKFFDPDGFMRLIIGRGKAIIQSLWDTGLGCSECFQISWRRHGLIYAMEYMTSINCGLDKGQAWFLVMWWRFTVLRTPVYKLVLRSPTRVCRTATVRVMSPSLQHGGLLYNQALLWFSCWRWTDNNHEQYTVNAVAAHCTY